jgi:hypothetical protein
MRCRSSSSRSCRPPCRSRRWRTDRRWVRSRCSIYRRWALPMERSRRRSPARVRRSSRSVPPGCRSPIRARRRSRSSSSRCRTATTPGRWRSRRASPAGTRPRPRSSPRCRTPTASRCSCPSRPMARRHS